MGDTELEKPAENTGNTSVSSNVVPPVVPSAAAGDALAAELAAIWMELGESERSDLLAVARGLAGRKATRQP